MGQGEAALATPYRPPDTDIARAVLLPLRQTVQQPPQAHIQESSISSIQNSVMETLPNVEFGAYPVADQVISATGSQHNTTECASLGLVNVVYSQEGNVLNPEADVFHVRDLTLVHQGRLAQNLDRDWAHVQRVEAGGIGDGDQPGSNLWEETPTCDGAGGKELADQSTSQQVEPVLPYQLENDLTDVLGIAPKQVHKVNMLLDSVMNIPSGKFVDKVLPIPDHKLQANEVFTADYYVAL